MAVNENHIDNITLLINSVSREKLWKIPSVVSIGFGLKEKQGRATSEYAFRVYVERKKTLGLLAPEERIPEEIDGFKTDVLVETSSHYFCCSSSLNPGDKIARHMTEKPTTVSEGTLGCVVQKYKDPNDHSKGMLKYILTNQHVVFPEDFNSAGVDVYHPHRKDCGGLECNKSIGALVSKSPSGTLTPDIVDAIKENRMINGKEFNLDCALILLKTGISVENKTSEFTIAPTISDISGLVAVQTTIPPSDIPLFTDPQVTVMQRMVITPTLLVKKMGGVTGYTEGTVVEIARERFIDKNNYVMNYHLQIVPNPAKAFTYKEKYELDLSGDYTVADVLHLFTGKTVTATNDPPGSNFIKFEGKVFSQEGDSGSVCLNSNNQIIGLLNKGGGIPIKVKNPDQTIFVPDGTTMACHILPVFNALGIDKDTGVVIGSVKASGETLFMPGDVIQSEYNPERLMKDRLSLLDKKVNAHSDRKTVQQMILLFNEAVELVRHRRRNSTLAWQRYKGPAFMTAGIRLFRGEDERMIKKLSKYSLENLLREMCAALLEEGSENMKTFLGQYGETISAHLLACETFDDLLELLELNFITDKFQPSHSYNQQHD
jgi:hypothetical protein